MSGEAVLDIWVLNVGKGDSIVLRHTDSLSGKESFGVIDSNVGSSASTSKAVAKLRELNAADVSFVLLTHPHSDHYSGLHQIIEEFDVEVFFSFPLLRFFGVEKNLNNMRENYSRLCLHESKDIRSKAVQFVKLLKAREEKAINLEECNGFENRLSVGGFSGVDFFAILPSARLKPDYMRRLESSDAIGLLESDDLNRLSVSLLLRYMGKELLFGADSTGDCWTERFSWSRRGGHPKISPDLIKISHHGSKKDTQDDFINEFFSEDGAARERYGIISAAGNKYHPSEAVITKIASKNINLFCTNLAPSCGSNLHKLKSRKNISHDLNRFINQSQDSHVNHGACQGDIYITVDDSGGLSVTSQTGNACIHNQSFKNLFS